MRTLDVERRRLVVEVLLPYAEAILRDLQMDGLRDRGLREAVAALLTEPVDTLGAYARPVRMMRALATIPDAAGVVDTVMVETAIRECFDLVLALT